MKANRYVACMAMGALALSLAACGGGDEDNGGATTVTWWTWDDKQAVSYQKCADAFETANPDIKVKVEQFAWDDYWTKLTTGFVGGTAPDAFQNHTSYYPEFADQGQILALDDLIAETGFDMSVFATGVDTWTYLDEKTYGLPKDWATIGFYYNVDMITEASLTEEDMNNLVWNPQDGGTFEKTVAHLTVDNAGVRGDEPGFNKDDVAVYGVGGLVSNGLNGQDSWSTFLSTTGWTLGDTDNWPTRFMYDEQVFKDSINNLRDLATKGYGPADGEFTMGVTEILGSGKAAMVTGGSWYAPDFYKLPGIKVAIAPSVIGPEGGRSSLTNSNADSIFSGSKHQAEAWKWISYMGSAECQSVAGLDGTFFPSIAESMEKAEAAAAEKGIDLSAYTKQFNEGTLFTTPMFQHGKELDATLSPMMESFFAFETGDEVFDEMSKQSEQILSQ